MSENLESQFFNLRRRKKNRMIAGVCTGASDMLRVDPVLLRLGFAALTIFGCGAGILLYLAAWIIVPEQDTDHSTS